MSTLYDPGFYEWCNQQIQILKDKQYDKIDRHNLIKNIQDIQYEIVRCLYRSFEEILTIYLTLSYNPDQYLSPEAQEERDQTLLHARLRIKNIFKNNPTLKNEKEFTVVYVSYIGARSMYYINTTADDDQDEDERIPLGCPYTLEQCLDENFDPKPNERAA